MLAEITQSNVIMLIGVAVAFAATIIFHNLFKD